MGRIPEIGFKTWTELHGLLMAQDRFENNAITGKGYCKLCHSALSRIEALRSGYDEGIMLNIDGMVAESSAENIFIVQDGILVTPPTTAGALDGVTRDSILEIARQNKIPYQIMDITRDELYTAEEVFLTGTAAGIKPVIEIDKRLIGNGEVGMVTKELQRVYEDIVRGRDSRFRKWLTYAK